MNSKQLTFAREMRGYSQKELASKVEGLTQPNLSKYEKGVGTLSYDLICDTMKVLDFPLSFLDLDISNKVDSKHYRKKASVKAGDRCEIDRFVSIVAYLYDNILDDFELPEFKVPQIDVESGAAPQEIANIVRRVLKLNNAPIAELCAILENNGILLYEWDCSIKGFDGVSLITDKGNPLIVINKNLPNDRKRFSIAHELGHIVMHANSDFVIFEVRDKEQEANDFASEFLMPTVAIKNSLYNLKLNDLPMLKRQWKVSMQAIIYKAYCIKAIDHNRYRYLMTEMSRRGWRVVEPYPIETDSPSILQQVNDMSIEDYQGIEELSKALSLPWDIVKKIMCKQSKVISFTPAI